MAELIEPLDEESVYARFPAEKGEGVQHVAVATPNFDETVARADRGNRVILSGEFGGGRVTYLGTDRDLWVIIEIFSGTSEGRPQPGETGPDASAPALNQRGRRDYGRRALINQERESKPTPRSSS